MTDAMVPDAMQRWPRLARVRGAAGGAAAAPRCARSVRDAAWCLQPCGQPARPAGNSIRQPADSAAAVEQQVLHKAGCSATYQP
jgi:hypothetical protein